MHDARPNEGPSVNDGSAALTSPVAIRFRLRTLFLVIAVVAVILGLGGRYVARRRAEARASQHRNDLRQLYYGLLNYESAKGVLPSKENADPNGKALSSWRLTIIPYLESIDIRWDLKVAWNAPSNRRMASIAPNYFCWDFRRNNPTTLVFAVTGPGTLFDGAPHTTKNMPGDIVLLLEVRDSKTHWMQPGDYRVTDLLTYRGKIGDHLSGVFDDRLHVLFADGEVWALSPDAPMTALHRFLTIAGAESHDRAKLLGPYRVR
jgi:hypothetical protein